MEMNQRQLAVEKRVDGIEENLKTLQVCGLLGSVGYWGLWVIGVCGILGCLVIQQRPLLSYRHRLLHSHYVFD